MKNENKTQPSPTVTFYNGDNSLGNAMGSIADRQGNNSGRPECVRAPERKPQ